MSIDELPNLFLRLGLGREDDLPYNLRTLPRFSSSDTTIVYKREGETGKEFVVKYNPTFYDGLREAIMYKSLSHPHIITCRDVEIVDYLSKKSYEAYWENNEKPIGEYEVDYIVKITMEKYLPCDNRDFERKARGDSGIMVKMFSEIVDAMNYLENSEILHSGIKSENIFYDERKDVFLLADFDKVTVGRDYYSTRAYTPTTAPPEMFTVERGVNDSQGDVFSLAVTISSLFIGTKWYLPLRLQDDELVSKVDRAEYERVLKIVAQKLGLFPFADLLIAMLAYDALQRPSISEIYDYLVKRGAIVPIYYPPVRLWGKASDRPAITKMVVNDFERGWETEPRMDVTNTNFTQLIHDTALFTTNLLDITRENFELLSEREKAFTLVLFEYSSFILVRALASPQTGYLYQKDLPYIVPYFYKTHPGDLKLPDGSENAAARLYGQESVNFDQPVVAALYGENPRSIFSRCNARIALLLDFKLLVRD